MVRSVPPVLLTVKDLVTVPPSGTLPNFHYTPAELPQGQFAVAITLDDPDQTKFPIGTQGRAAIYTSPKSAFIVLRKIAIRGYSWYNWLYPFSG